MKDDNESIVATVAIISAFLALLTVSSCNKETFKAARAGEMYTACVNAQKSTPVDMRCGGVASQGGQGK